MAIKYSYGATAYNTREEAESGKIEQQARLQNNPTDFIVVKEVTGSQETGWQINPTTLTDSEILNLDTTKVYNIYCPITGENLIPVTAEEVNQKVSEYRSAFCEWKNFDHGIFEIDTDLLVPEARALI